MKHQDPMDDWLRGMFSKEFDGLNDLEFASGVIKRLNRQAFASNLILVVAFVIGALVAWSVFAELESLFTPWIAMADAKLQSVDVPSLSFDPTALSPMLLPLLVVPWWLYSMNDN